MKKTLEVKTGTDEMLADGLTKYLPRGKDKLEQIMKTDSKQTMLNLDPSSNKVTPEKKKEKETFTLLQRPLTPHTN